jgi:hypothetical protein
MAVAHAIDDALQLTAGIADVLVSKTEPKAHGALKVFAPVLAGFSPWHTNSAQSYVKCAIELLPQPTAYDLHHIRRGKI